MTLKEYCKNKGITMMKLSEMTGISYRHIQEISYNPKMNVFYKTVQKIAQATNKEFGTPLLPWQYLEGVEDLKLLINK